MGLRKFPAFIFHIFCDDYNQCPWVGLLKWWASLYTLSWIYKYLFSMTADVRIYRASHDFLIFSDKNLPYLTPGNYQHSCSLAVERSWDSILYINFYLSPSFSMALSSTFCVKTIWSFSVTLFWIINSYFFQLGELGASASPYIIIL